MVRLDAAISLREPDRVPFAPKISLFYCTGYNVSAYDVMKDFRNAEPVIKSFINDYDPDLAWPPSVYPINPPEALGPESCAPGGWLGIDGAFHCGAVVVYLAQFL